MHIFQMLTLFIYHSICEITFINITTDPIESENEVKVKVVHLCPTLCESMDYTVYEILQARILEWVAFPFSRGSSQARDRTQVSHMAGGFFTS